MESMQTNSMRHSLKKKINEALSKLKEGLEKKNRKNESNQDRITQNVKRLKKAGEMFEKCHMKIGKVGKVTDMIYQNTPDSPITIKSKPSYVELDLYDLQLWNDDFKTEQFIDFKLENIEKLTIPRSFR